MVSQFEWDEEKNQSNILKHGLGFEDVITVFDHPVLASEDDWYDYGEKRILAIGQIGYEVEIVRTLVYTERGNKIRIISARKANTKERTLYHDFLRESIEKAGG